MCATKQYTVIYADPPWAYSFSKSRSRSIESHYETMTIDEICALNVPAAPNSVLYLWATAPKLLEAIRVVHAWGFTYKTHCIWDKQLLGMGYWFRGQHELLLVACKGAISPPEQSLRKGSVFSIRRGRHSEKPSHIRDCIMSWFPNASRLEMFARTRSAGWDVFGNEVPCSIELGAQNTIESGSTDVQQLKVCHAQSSTATV